MQNLKGYATDFIKFCSNTAISAEKQHLATYLFYSQHFDSVLLLRNVDDCYLKNQRLTKSG